MVKIITFIFALLGKQKQQIKQQEIFTAKTENSFSETGTSKSTGEGNVISVRRWFLNY